MRFFSALWLVPFLVLGCGDKSAVSLSAHISDADIRVQDTAFGASLSGTFKLVLALGPESSGATTVTLGNFSLQSEAGASLVDVLRAESDTRFPLLVDKGTSKSVTLMLAVDTVERDVVCAGPVRIVGSVMDSLKGGTDPVSSGPIMPDCGAI